MSRSRLVRRRATRGCGRLLPVLAAVVAALAPAGAAAQPVRPQPVSLVLPVQRPAGAAWDGRNLAVIDEASGRIALVDPRTGASVRSLETGVKRPRALAFNGQALWVGDDETMTLSAVDPATGRVTRTLKLPVPAEKGFTSLEGLAWDGKYLWAAYFAGFSSSLNQIDPGSGRIVRSVFADCHPRGIAADGKHLWTICYNGEKLPPKLDRRSILAQEHEMLRSRVFLGDVEARDPAGLVFDGESLWLTDRAAKRTLKLSPKTPGER